MARSRSSFRYVCSRSSVQQPNGSPRLSGFSSATAMTSPICSAVYVGGRPDRGWSCKPSSPRALNRVIHFRTTWGVTRTIRAMSDTHHPSADQAMIVARSRSRTDPARVPRQSSIVARSASLSSRTRSFMSRSFIAAPQHDFCLPIVLSGGCTLRLRADLRDAHPNQRRERCRPPVAFPRHASGEARRRDSFRWRRHGDFCRRRVGDHDVGGWLLFFLLGKNHRDAPGEEEKSGHQTTKRTCGGVHETFSGCRVSSVSSRSIMPRPPLSAVRSEPDAVCRVGQAVLMARRYR